MWHLREISDDEVTIYILSYSYSELRLVVSECIIFEDFLDPDGISFFIWDFDPDESKSWDRSLNTDRFCFECECEIFFQAFDLCKTYSLTRSEAILYNSRTDTLPFHIDIDTELKKCFLYQDRFLFDLIG